LEQKHKIVLALLLSAEEPLQEKHVERCLDTEVEMENIVNQLNYDLNRTDMPFEVQNVAGGYKVVTRARYEPWLNRLLQKSGDTTLSQAALETLAIVAYTQPTTKSEIDSIRGVNTSMKTLLDRELVEVKGRLDAPGRPLLYRTTDQFLEYFGISSLEELPKMKEIEEILEEQEDGN